MLRSVAAVLERAPDKDWDWGDWEKELCSCLTMMTEGLMSRMNEGAWIP